MNHFWVLNLLQGSTNILYVNIKIVNKKQLGLFAMNILVNAGKKFEIFEQ